MKKARFTFDRWAAWFFLTAFVAAFSAREAHRFGHAHDEPKAHCSAEKGEKHWHDEHFEIDDCAACAFVFAAAEWPVFPHFLIEKKAVFPARAFFEKGQIERLFEGRAAGRGPPEQGFFA